MTPKPAEINHDALRAATESPVTNAEAPRLDKILRGWGEMMQRGAVDMEDLPFIAPKLLEAATALASLPQEGAAGVAEPVAWAKSLAKLAEEWISTGESIGTDWRPGLELIIQKRLERLAARAPSIAPAPDAGKGSGEVANAKAEAEAWCRLTGQALDALDAISTWEPGPDLGEDADGIIGFADESAKLIRADYPSTSERIPFPPTPDPDAARREIDPDAVEWIVNDNGELGIKIGDQFFFLYKGESLVYEEGTHDDGRPLRWRHVYKREFGECCHPLDMKSIQVAERAGYNIVEIHHFDASDEEWQDVLPARQP